VCCAPRGEAGALAPGCDLGASTLAETRTRELHRAAAALGAGDVVLLDFIDSDMAGEPGPDTLAGATFESVVDAVAGVVARVDPDVVVTLDPSGVDGHRDHARIGAATTEAVRRRGGDVTLYHWAIARSLFVRWVEAQRQADAGRVDLEVDPTELGRADDEFTTIIDVGAYVRQRRAAIALHASQQSPFADMPPDLVDAFLRFDRLVRVEPPWTGGPTETALHLPERRP